MTKANWNIDGTMASAQRAAIIAALNASSFRISEAARILAIGRSTLYRLLRVYEIPVPEPHVVTDAHQPSAKLVARPNGRSKLAEEVEGFKVTLKDGSYYLSKD